VERDELAVLPLEPLLDRVDVPKEDQREDENRRDGDGVRA
jgi:hypothetical protein